MAVNPTSDLHEAAHAWAAAGFYVFPCTPGAKTPATAHGLKDATTNFAKIDAWWTENPSYNIGVSPAPSAMWVLDTDGPLGRETLAALEAENDALPLTLTIATPRGTDHRHHWFTGSCPSSVGKLGPKLDTRGEGGYVLVPPSTVNGKEYTYVGDTDDIAPGPDWLVARCISNRERHVADDGAEVDTPGNVERARVLLQSYVGSGNVAREGHGGDDCTYQTAASLLGLGVSPRIAWELMRDHWNPHCIPPWDADELATKVQNAADYMQNEIGAWAVPPAAETFAAFARSVPAIDPPKRSKFYPADEGEQDERPPPSWLLEGLLPAESTVMLYGPPYKYKSFLALDLALTLASGRAGYGAPARDPVDTVYIAAEGSRGIERLRRPAWRLAHGITGPLPFYTIDTMPLVARPQEIIETIEAIKARGLHPKLLVLDTVARALAGKNENDARDAGEFIEAIELLKRELRCTVLAVHHTGKDEDRGGRGSSALPAGFDAIIEIKTNQALKVVALHVRKMKDADAAETPWTFEGHVVGPSLVFYEIGTDAYRKLVKGDDQFGHSKIGAALRSMRAIGPEAGVTTTVLASHVTPLLIDEKSEERAQAVTRTSRQLGMLAKVKLEGYTVGSGKSLRWCLPATDDV